MRVDFAPPNIGEAEIEAVAEVMRSGWITTGKKVREFEDLLTEKCGSSGTVALSSCSAALEMALRLLGIGPGDEVITTAYTYSATAAAICHVGATLVLADIPDEGYLITAEMLEPLITPKTKAVIPVDFAGIPCDYLAIRDMLEANKRLFEPNNDIAQAIGRVAVISDCAHSIGAKLASASVCSIADFSCLSFHAVKNVTTAEGGALCWREIQGITSGDIYRRLSILSLHGQTKTAFQKQAGGSWEYDILLPGYKCNMTDISAAIGIVQMRRYPDALSRRAQLAEIYKSALDGLGLTLPYSDLEGISPSYHLYPVYVPRISEDERAGIIDALAAGGISANVHYKPLPMLTAYKRMGFNPDDYRNAVKKYTGEITLPLHTLMTDEQAMYVSVRLKEAMRKIF